MINNRDKQIIELDQKLNSIWDLIPNDPSRAYSESIKIEKKSRVIDYQEGITNSRFYQAWCLIYQSQLKEAIEILSSLANEYSNDKLNENYIKILNALGVAYNDLGDNTNAFYYFSKSLKQSRKAKIPERELSVLNNLGAFFVDNNNFDKALRHYQLILEKTEKHDVSLELKSAALSNTGFCYYRLKNYTEAEKFLIRGMEISIQINNRNIEVDNLHDLAAIKIDLGQKETARDYINKGLSISIETDNKRSECELLLMLGEIDNSSELYIKALEKSNAIGFKPVSSSCYFKLSNHYEKTGNHKKALDYLKEHHKIKESLNSKATEKKFHNLEMEYEVERNRKNTEIFKIKNMELEDSLNWMTILNRIAQETISSLELHNVFRTVYKNINIIMDAEIFHVAFYDKTKDTIEFFLDIENGDEIKPFSISADSSKSFTAWTIKNNKMLAINDIEKEYKNYIDTRSTLGDGPETKSLINIPLRSMKEVIGIVSIQSFHTNAYKEEHIQLLKSLASYFSIAIENSRNYEKVKELNKIILEEKEELEAANKKISQLASHDNLTGLSNRTLFNELLESAMLQAKRRDEILAVLFIDLDNFKPINDTWGHDTGDQVLVEIANRFKHVLRSSDSVARIGGDEFLILLNPVMNSNDAKKVAEKIRMKVNKPIKIKDTEIQVGMSIGICLYPEHETLAEKLIISADSAMYRIKKGEKNGIGFYTNG